MTAENGHAARAIDSPSVSSYARSERHSLHRQADSSMSRVKQQAPSFAAGTASSKKRVADKNLIEEPSSSNRVRDNTTSSSSVTGVKVVSHPLRATMRRPPQNVKQTPERCTDITGFLKHKEKGRPGTRLSNLSSVSTKSMESGVDTPRTPRSDVTPRDQWTYRSKLGLSQSVQSELPSPFTKQDVKLPPCPKEFYAANYSGITLSINSALSLHIIKGTTLPPASRPSETFERSVEHKPSSSVLQSDGGFEGCTQSVLPAPTSVNAVSSQLKCHCLAIASFNVVIMPQRGKCVGVETEQRTLVNRHLGTEMSFKCERSIQCSPVRVIGRDADDLWSNFDVANSASATDVSPLNCEVEKLMDIKAFVTSTSYPFESSPSSVRLSPTTSGCSSLWNSEIETNTIWSAPTIPFPRINSPKMCSIENRAIETPSSSINCEPCLSVSEIKYCYISTNELSRCTSTGLKTMAQHSPLRKKICKNCSQLSVYPSELSTSCQACVSRPAKRKLILRLAARLVSGLNQIGNHLQSLACCSIVQD